VRRGSGIVTFLFNAPSIARCQDSDNDTIEHIGEAATMAPFAAREALLGCAGGNPGGIERMRPIPLGKQDQS
jgi:hypothetical protein